MNEFSSPLIYNVSLKTVALVLGGIGLPLHLVMLWKPAQTISWLRNRLRDVQTGTALLVAGGVWACALTATMDLGEMSPLRWPLTCLWAVGTVAVAIFLKEFIFVRAMGLLLILGANVLLDAAFMHPSPWRYVISVTAYLWAIKGMVYFATPHLMRDGLTWANATPERFKYLTYAGILYSLLLLLLAASQY